MARQREPQPGNDLDFLKTQPRLTGKSTHVIITEYDLPNPLIQPHDVMLDRAGNVWYSDFGQMFLGKMDPKTGKVTQYPIPVVKPGWPEGTLDLEFDTDDNPWVGVMYQSAIAKFDRRPRSSRCGRPPRNGTPTAASSAISRSKALLSTIKCGSKTPMPATSTGSIWCPTRWRILALQGSADRQAHRDLRHPLGRAEQCLSARFFSREYRQDRRQDEERNRLPDSDSELPSAARSRRSRGRLWFAEYQGNAIGMFDPETET